MFAPIFATVSTFNALDVALDDVFHPITLNPLAAVIVGDVIWHVVSVLYNVQFTVVALIDDAPFVLNVAVIFLLCIT